MSELNLTITITRSSEGTVVLRDGTGRIEAPAVKILSEPYRNVILIFFTDEGDR
ncbi:hypothetical protein [Thermococcus sp.]